MGKENAKIFPVNIRIIKFFGRIFEEIIFFELIVYVKLMYPINQSLRTVPNVMPTFFFCDFLVYA